jgi:hypothetical protein
MDGSSTSVWASSAQATDASLSDPVLNPKMTSVQLEGLVSCEERDARCCLTGGRRPC